MHSKHELLGIDGLLCRKLEKVDRWKVGALPSSICRGFVWKNIEDDNNIAIYDIQDEEFKRLLNSPEWAEQEGVE